MKIRNQALRACSRIGDMEAESYNWSHLLIGEHLDYFLFLFVSRTGTVGWTEHAKVCAHYNLNHCVANCDVVYVTSLDQVVDSPPHTEYTFGQ